MQFGPRALPTKILAVQPKSDEPTRCTVVVAICLVVFFMFTCNPSCSRLSSKIAWKSGASRAKRHKHNRSNRLFFAAFTTSFDAAFAVAAFAVVMAGGVAAKILMGATWDA